MKRVAVIVLVLLVQGCAFAQLGEDLSAFYASIEVEGDAIRCSTERAGSDR